MADRCYGCFSPVPIGTIRCPYCGYSLSDLPDAINILPPGTVLEGKYVIGKTLGEGGFGITYLAWDKNMEVKIAIKEFYPSGMIARDITSEKKFFVYTISEAGSANYKAGLERYVREAAVLAKFYNLPGIVSVKDFFYGNHTAYIVMEYIEGVSLKDYLKQKGNRIGVQEMKRIMEPVLRSLSVIHENKLLHRDISPDNIMLGKDGTVKLIDFGAARYFEGKNGDDKSKTVMLKHGYAPIEQYSRNGKQGIWTDIYSLCATMYRMLTGVVPDDAPDRMKEDHLKSPRSAYREIPVHVSEAICQGLSLNKDERQQSVAELYHSLYMDKAELRLHQKNKMYKIVNRVLIKVAVLMLILASVSVIILVNRDRVYTFWMRLSGVFDDTNTVSEDWQAEEYIAVRDDGENDDSADITQKMKETAEEESTEEKQSENSEGEVTGLDEFPQTVEDDSQSDIAYNPMANVASPQSEEESTLEHAVVVARDGKLNLTSTSMTVGEILDSYSDSEGVWTSYEDENEQMFAYYQGLRYGESFILEFRIYTDDTFKLTGAAQNGMQLNEYSSFFQSILETEGLM